MIEVGESNQAKANPRFRRKHTCGTYFFLTLIAFVIGLVALWLPYLFRSNVFDLPILNNFDNIVRVSGFEATGQNAQGVFRRLKPSASVELPETLLPRFVTVGLSVTDAPTGTVTIYHKYGAMTDSIPVEKLLISPERKLYKIKLKDTTPFDDVGIIEFETKGGQVAIWSMQLEAASRPSVWLIMVVWLVVFPSLGLGLGLGFSVLRALVMGLTPAIASILYWQADRLGASGLPMGLFFGLVAFVTLLLVNQKELFPPIRVNKFYLTIAKRWRVLPLLALAVLVGLVYSRVFGYELFYDDYHVVRPWELGEVLGTFAGTWDPLRLEPVYFRPITVVSFYLDWLIWQFNPFGYHLTNWVLHLVATILVYALLLRLRLGWLAALAGASLFAVLPFNAVTATWISQRSDALALIGILGGLWFFITVIYALPPIGTIGIYDWKYIFACLCFLFALGAKEIAVVFPALCLLYLPVAVSRSAIPFPFKREGGGKSKNPHYILRLVVYTAIPFGIVGLYLVYRSLVLPADLPRESRTGLEVLWQGYSQVVSESFYGFGENFNPAGAGWCSAAI
jgi:hypothetical protein